MSRSRCECRIIGLASIIACFSFIFGPLVHVSHAMGMYVSNHGEAYIDQSVSDCGSRTVVQKTDCMRCCFGRPAAGKETGATLKNIFDAYAPISSRVCYATGGADGTSCRENDMRGSPVFILSTQKRE